MNYKDISVDDLELSIRSLNALKNAGIINLEQIIEQTASSKGFSNIPNLGKKSINEIESKIKVLDLERVENIKDATEKKLNLKFDNIKKCIDYLFDTKFKKNKEVLKKRIFDGATLDECGREIGVTRERIRQIESTFFRNISAIITDDYVFEIKDYFKNSSGINGFYELDNVGPAYKNISSYLSYSSKPDVFLKFFFKSKELIKWQKKKDKYYLYSFENNSLDDLINDDELLNFIESSHSESLRESVRIYCLIKNQETNFDYIHEEIKQKISQRPGFACLYAVKQLKKNYTYISLDQILDFLKENCGKDFSSSKRTLDNILSSSYTDQSSVEIKETNLYIAKGSGNYFFLDKLAIDDDFKKELVNFVVKLMKKNLEKTYNSYEFLSRFTETQTFTNSTSESLNKYLIDAVLLDIADEYDVLNYVGRSSWTGKKNVLHNERIEIYPTVLNILQENGAPMRLKEIKDCMEKIRGHGRNFQLHTTLSTSKVIQLSSAFWGLRERDINISHDEEFKLVSFIKEEFKKGNSILDFNNLLSFKKSIGIDENVSIFQITRILLGHIPVGRRRSPKQLIFLCKMNRGNPLNFCIYSPVTTDIQAQEYLDLKVNEEFVDARNNEDSIMVKTTGGAYKLQEYIIEGQTYSGRAEVAKKYDISLASVSFRANSDKFPQWKALKDYTNRRRANPKSLMKKYLIEGKTYLGRLAVTEEYNISIYTLNKRIDSVKYPEWKKVD